MRHSIWMCWLTGLLSITLALALPACTGSSNGNGDHDGTNGDSDGDGGDNGDDDTKTLVWSARVEVDDEQAGSQLDMAAMPDGQNFAIAYFKNLDCENDGDCPIDVMSCDNGVCVGECSEPILGDVYTEVIQDQVRYAWSDGENWQHEDVATVATVMLTGISIVFDGSTPLIAYLGGTPLGGLQVCGGTDLIVASGPGTWNEDVAVAVSNEATAGDDCPGMQGICDFGDVVGLWPSMAKAPDGTIGVVYRDIHNGYTKDADDSADLEYAYGHVGSWTHEWIDLGRGGGDFPSLAFKSDSEPAVVYYNGEQGLSGGSAPNLFATRPFGDYTQRAKPCSSAADCPNGQACDGNECICTSDSQCEAPRRCVLPHGICSPVVDSMESGLPEKSLSLAIGPDDRYLVAYFDVDEKNLMIAHSMDGLTWTRGLIDSQNSTGLYPSLVVDPLSGKPGVAYYRCSDYSPNELECNKNQDGLLYAYFSGEYPAELTTQSKWKKTVVSDDPNAFDGMWASAAVLPDGRVGIAYQYTWYDISAGITRLDLMFRLGTWE